MTKIKVAELIEGRNLEFEVKTIPDENLQRLIDDVATPAGRVPGINEIFVAAHRAVAMHGSQPAKSNEPSAKVRSNKLHQYIKDANNFKAKTKRMLGELSIGTSQSATSGVRGRLGLQEVDDINEANRIIDDGIQAKLLERLGIIDEFIAAADLSKSFFDRSAKLGPAWKVGQERRALAALELFNLLSSEPPKETKDTPWHKMIEWIYLEAGHSVGSETARELLRTAKRAEAPKLFPVSIPETY